MNGDPRIVGEPLGSIAGYELYNPLLYILAVIKYCFHDAFIPYIFASLKPFFCTAIAGIGFIFFWGIIREVISQGRNIHGTAREAVTRDLRVNGLLHKSGVILGQLSGGARVRADKIHDTALHLKLLRKGRLICHSGKANTLLLAPTGSGKGVSVLIPTLLSYKGSMIIYDPKGENYNLTAGWRKTFSRVIKFAPCSNETIRFNPIMAIRDGDEYAFRDANLIADILFAPSKAGSQNDTEAYFSNAAKDLTATAILHVRFCDEIQDKNLAGVLQFLTMTDYKRLEEDSNDDGNADQGKAQFLGMIKAKHYYQSYNSKTGRYEKREAKKLHEIIEHGAMRQLNRNPKEKSSVFSTVFSKMQLFEDPQLAAATSGSDFEIEDFITSAEPISLYLTIPYSDVQRISPVFRLLISFMLKKFSEGETQHGSVKLKHHLIFMLDEFPTLGCFPDIAQVMGVLRGYGINFIIVCQALSQLIDVYGQNHPFLDHCTVQVVFAPGSAADAKTFTDAIGNETVREEKLSRSGRRFSGDSNLNYSDNTIGRGLLDPADLKRLPGDKCLIMAHGMQPYFGTKCVYYQDSRFKGRLAYKAPADMKELYEEIAGLPSRRRIASVKASQKISEKQREAVPVREVREVRGREHPEMEDTLCLGEEEEAILALFAQARKGPLVDGEGAAETAAEMSAFEYSMNNFG